MAGLALGVILSSELRPIAWPMLAAGIAIHLFGMVSTRRLLSSIGHRPSLLERAGYWLCWAVIVAVLLYGAWALIP